MNGSKPEDQAQRIKDELLGGNKIQAIKIYREQTGVGLKEAKDAVEKLEAELRTSSPDQFAKPRAAGCSTIILIILMISIGVAFWLLRRQ